MSLQPTEKTNEDPKAEAPSESQENRDFSSGLLDIVGVTPKSFSRFHSALELELSRLEDASSRIVNRKLRRAVDSLGSIVKDIIVEGQGDHNVIREEISLPNYLKRVADSLYLYVDLASSLNFHEDVQSRIGEIENMVGLAGPFFADVLDRMESNKAKPDMARTRVMSRVFSALRRDSMALERLRERAK